jgi:hypothetical protein
MKENDNLKKKKRPVYEPPKARDLTAFTVDGGTCRAGGAPDPVGCNAGSVPVGCAAGATP